MLKWVMERGLTTDGVCPACVRIERLDMLKWAREQVRLFVCYFSLLHLPSPRAHLSYFFFFISLQGCEWEWSFCEAVQTKNAEVLQYLIDNVGPLSSSITLCVLLFFY